MLVLNRNGAVGLFNGSWNPSRSGRRLWAGPVQSESRVRPIQYYPEIWT